MAITYSTASANARLTACLITTSTAAGVSVDGQSSFGQLFIGTASLALPATGVLAIIPLPKPSFSVASKVATMLGVPLSAAASAGGTAALAALADSGNNGVITGLTVATSAANINLNSVAISSGETVTITSATVTHV